MVRLPGLIDALTACDGRDRGSVDHVARTVREAGFIQTTGRGMAASPMTALDAAALVLSLYGLADATARSMTDLRGLTELRRRKPQRNGSALGEVAPLPDAFIALQRAPTLLGACAALIELGGVLGGRGRAAVRAQMRLRRPLQSAVIRMTWSDDDGPQTLDLSYRAAGREPASADQAYAVETTVLTRTFVTLHRAVFDDR